MGLPLVGKRHQRKTNTSQTAGRRFGEISKRVGSAVGSGRSSVNHQQPIATAEPTAEPRSTLFGSTTSARNCLPRRYPRKTHTVSVRKELDSPTVGQFPPRRNQDRRGGTLATRSGRGRWNQSQDQVRDVGFVFTCRSLGILRPQSDFIGNTSRNWGKERSKHWRTRQCEASARPPWSCQQEQVKLGLAQLEFRDQLARVSGWCVRNTSRGTRRTALAGLRLRQHEFQRATFILLASGRTSEERQKRKRRQSCCRCIRALKACLAGVEITESSTTAGGFRLPVS